MQNNTKIIKEGSSEEKGTMSMMTSTVDTHAVHSCEVDLQDRDRILTQPRRSHIIENFMILWLDPNMNESRRKFRDLIVQLRSIINAVELFTDSEQCVNRLTEINDENVYLILSGEINEILISFIHDIPRLNSIYMLSDQLVEIKPSIQKWTKVKKISTNIKDIFDILKRDVRWFDINLTPMSVLPPSSTINLNELDQSFMYSQLLKEILLNLNYDDKSKKDFVDFCRLHYTDNNATLHAIDIFERDYTLHSPIWWYTKEWFLYSMLNKALRTQNIDVIRNMGFFVRDLHNQIQQVYCSTSLTTQITVYRGQGVFNAEFEKMKKSVGGLLSFNNFLSTSIDREVSFAFADSAREDLNLTGILLELRIDSSISSAPFASLDDFSYFSDTEKEMLFSMHTVFRINDMYQIDDRFWCVNAMLTSDTDQQLLLLTEYIRKEIQGSTGFHRLANLMAHMGEFTKSEEVYEMLLETTSNDDWEQVAFIRGQLGYVHLRKGDLENALSHTKQSLDIYLMHLPPDSSELADIYCNIGAILKKQEDLDGALQHYQRALNIDLCDPQPDQRNIANQHNNIGAILMDQGKFIEALPCFERALEILVVHLPSGHPLLATTYNNIGASHSLMKNYLSGLSYRQKALAIMKRCLPPEHISFAGTYCNIAGDLDDLQKYDEAIEYASLAVDIARHTLGSNHSDVILFEEYLDTIRRKL